MKSGSISAPATPRCATTRSPRFREGADPRARHRRERRARVQPARPARDLRLSRQAYVGIFTGEIRNWNDPRIAKTNPGVKLPNLTIATVVRQDGSGTTFAFTKHLDAISDAWRTRYGAATLVNWPGNSMRASGNEGVAARIKASIGSVGYVGYEFARRAGLRVALLENRRGSSSRLPSRARPRRWPASSFRRTCGSMCPIRPAPTRIRS